MVIFLILLCLACSRAQPSRLESSEDMFEELSVSVGGVKDAIEQDKPTVKIPLGKSQNKLVCGAHRLNSVLKPGTEFSDGNGHKIATPKGVKVVQGHACGNKKESVTLGVSDSNGLTGEIHGSGDGGYVISAKPGSNTGKVTKEKVFLHPPALHDQKGKVPYRVPASMQRGMTHEQHVAKLTEGQQANIGRVACLTVNVDVDSNLRGRLGGDAQAAAYMVQLFTAVSAVFERDLNMPLKLGSVIVRTTASDPYINVAKNPLSLLTATRNWWNANFANYEDANIVIMLTGHHGGGRADGIGGLNRTFNSAQEPRPYCMAMTIQGGLHTWDQFVVAHELGHVIGTGHTFDPNYYNPVATTCYRPDYWGTLNCNGQRPLGGIMSYCHACPGGLNNIVLDFTQRPEQTVRNYISTYQVAVDTVNNNCNLQNCFRSTGYACQGAYVATSQRHNGKVVYKGVSGWMRYDVRHYYWWGHGYGWLCGRTVGGNRYFNNCNRQDLASCSFVTANQDCPEPHPCVPCYQRKYTRKWPHCRNIGCYRTWLGTMKVKCSKAAGCDGFSWSTGASGDSHWGWGCLKKSCSSAQESSGGFGYGSHDYYVACASSGCPVLEDEAVASARIQPDAEQSVEDIATTD